VSQDSCR